MLHHITVLINVVLYIPLLFIYKYLYRYYLLDICLHIIHYRHLYITDIQIIITDIYLNNIYYKDLSRYYILRLFI